MIVNERYGFTPPGGSTEIRIQGAQQYSPGQIRKNDIWLMNCPDEYAGKLPQLGKGESYSSYAECVRVLADAFCAGDQSQVVLTQ